MPAALSILALIGDGILGAKEHSWGQSALAETHTPKEKAETCCTQLGLRMLWHALKMPQFVVITENGRAGKPESQRGETTFSRAHNEHCGNLANLRITGHLIKRLLAQTQENSLQIADF